MMDNTRPDGVAPVITAASTTPTLVVAGNDKDAVDHFNVQTAFRLSPILNSFKFLEFESAADHARVERSALHDGVVSRARA